MAHNQVAVKINLFVVNVSSSLRALIRNPLGYLVQGYPAKKWQVTIIYMAPTF